MAAILSREDVIAVISEEAGVPRADIKPESTLLSLGLESLEAVSLIQELEERSGQDISGRYTMTVGELLGEIGLA